VLINVIKMNLKRLIIKMLKVYFVDKFLLLGLF